MKILRVTDQVKISIDGVNFYVSPLTRNQKRELGNCRFVEAGEDKINLLEANTILLRYGLKKVEGLESYDGDEYELSFNGDSLSEESIDDLLGLPVKEKLCAASWSIVNGEFETFKMDGVALEVVSKKKPES